MNSAGITNRIYNFALALLGWMRGGLGHVNIIGSVIFAGMSGTAIADAAGLGTIEIKAMKDQGYATEFSVGVTAASATLGPIIPPSLPFVIYALFANVSVGALFLAGILPGGVMAILMMLTVAYYAHRYEWGSDVPFQWKRVIRAFGELAVFASWPAAVWGATELGADPRWTVALGLAWYRTLSWKMLVEASMETIETTAAVLFIVAAASIFGWMLTETRTTEMIANWVLSVTHSPATFLMLANLLMLFVGCFLEPTAAITILVPILLPIVRQLGIDPVHFGLVMVLNLMIGLLHPPMGLVLFVLARVARVSVERTTMAILPWLVPLLVSLVIVTYIPSISLWLPKLFH